MRIRILVVGAVVAIGSGASASAQAVGDPATGERIFALCRACHAVGPGAVNKIGPELNGIVGEKPGEVEGYRFSLALAAYGEGRIWNAETLTPWLAGPKAVVPGTKMAFAGLRRPEDIADLIAYLATFDEAGATRDPAAALAAAAVTPAN